MRRRRGGGRRWKRTNSVMQLDAEMKQIADTTNEMGVVINETIFVVVQKHIDTRFFLIEGLLPLPLPLPLLSFSFVPPSPSPLALSHIQ